MTRMFSKNLRYFCVLGKLLNQQSLFSATPLLVMSQVYVYGCMANTLTPWNLAKVSALHVSVLATLGEARWLHGLVVPVFSRCLRHRRRPWRSASPSPLKYCKGFHVLDVNACYSSQKCVYAVPNRRRCNKVSNFLLSLRFEATHLLMPASNNSELLECW